MVIPDHGTVSLTDALDNAQSNPMLLVSVMPILLLQKEFIDMLPQPTIEAFDTWLSNEGIRFDAIVVGGSALALMGAIERQTRDFDIMDPILPSEVLHAARDFALHLRTKGVDLTDDWLNNGPLDLSETLPKGWRDHLEVVFVGKAITLRSLGRADLLLTKLFALCDRGTDLADCIALRPTKSELQDAEPWVAQQDANPMWPDHVHTTFMDLQRRLGYGV